MLVWVILVQHCDKKVREKFEDAASVSPYPKRGTFPDAALLWQDFPVGSR